VRYFDSSPWYGRGLAELRLGTFLRGQNRDDFVVSTKVGRTLHRPPGGNNDAAKRDFPTAPWAGGCQFSVRHDYSYDGIMRSYEDSLQRLGLNRVDVLLVHDLDANHFAPEALQAQMTMLNAGGGWRALENLKNAGEVKAIGAGVNHEGTITHYLDTFQHPGPGGTGECLAPDVFLISQSCHTLLDQHLLTGAKGELARCAEAGIGLVVGSPFAGGILGSGTRRGEDVPLIYNYEPAPEDVVSRVQRIEALLDAHAAPGTPLPAAALQFVCAHPNVASVIPGAVEPALVAANASALAPDAAIPAPFWEALKEEGLLPAEAPTPADCC